MAEQGAALQTYNLELVKFLEDLKSKRNHLLEIIKSEEHQKRALKNEIQELQSKFDKLDKTLQGHKRIYGTYEKIITDADSSFKKIVESSRALLNLMQLETDKVEHSSQKTLVPDIIDSS